MRQTRHVCRPIKRAWHACQKHKQNKQSSYNPVVTTQVRERVWEMMGWKDNRMDSGPT